MFGLGKKMMENRIQQLEWLICHGDHDWAPVGVEEMKNGKEYIPVTNLTCRKCNKQGFRIGTESQKGDTGKIGF